MVPGFPSGPIVVPQGIVVTPTPVGVGGGTRSAAWVQHALNQLSVEGTPLVEDNSYGRKTRNAVRAFQAAHGLDADGLAGPKTIAALEREFAN
jgi:peptidoglycan hydrolase-like protein with peptidoglycan-binding domain